MESDGVKMRQLFFSFAFLSISIAHVFKSPSVCRVWRAATVVLNIYLELHLRPEEMCLCTIC